MRLIGNLLVILGGILLVAAAYGVQNTPNVSYAIGTFLPGLLALIVGLKLSRPKRPTADTLAAESPRAKAFLTASNAFVGFGLALGVVSFLTLGSDALGIAAGVGTFRPASENDRLLPAVVLSLFAYPLFVWGCVNYARWKGQSGWLGLFGYGVLPGLIVLMLVPNRRRWVARQSLPPDDADRAALAAGDRLPGRRYLLVVAPAVLLGVAAVGLVLRAQRGIDPAAWQAFAPPGLGIRGELPGTPQVKTTVTPSPAGDIDLQKFLVTPAGRSELYMVMSLAFPEAVAAKLGGPEKLLDLARQDVVTSTGGQVVSEQRTEIAGVPALEMRLRPKGGGVARVRAYARGRQIVQAFVQTSPARIDSADVERFFAAVRLVDDRDAAK